MKAIVSQVISLYQDTYRLRLFFPLTVENLHNSSIVKSFDDTYNPSFPNFSFVSISSLPCGVLPFPDLLTVQRENSPPPFPSSIESFSSMVLVYFDLILDYFEPSLWLLRHVQLVHPRFLIQLAVSSFFLLFIAAPP